MARADAVEHEGCELGQSDCAGQHSARIYVVLDRAETLDL